MTDVTLTIRRLGALDGRSPCAPPMRASRLPAQCNRRIARFAWIAKLQLRKYLI